MSESEKKYEYGRRDEDGAVLARYSRDTPDQAATGERIVTINLDNNDGINMKAAWGFVNRHERVGEPGSSTVGALLSRIDQALIEQAVYDLNGTLVRREVGEWKPVPPEIPTMPGSVVRVEFPSDSRSIVLLGQSWTFVNTGAEVRDDWADFPYTVLYDAGVDAP